MKSNVFLWITLFILFIGNISFFWLLRNRQSSSVSLTDILVENNEASINSYMIRQLLNHMEFDFKLIQNVTMREILYSKYVGQEIERASTIPLHSLLDKSKVLFVFTQYGCNSCISDQLIQLDKLGRMIGQDNIIIMTDLCRGDLQLFMKSNKLKLNIYETSLEQTGIFDKVQVASVLFLTSGSQIATSFIVDMDTKEYASVFYEFTKGKF